MVTALQEYFAIALTLFKVLILVILSTEFLATLYAVCIAQDVTFLLMTDEF